VPFVEISRKDWANKLVGKKEKRRKGERRREKRRKDFNLLHRSDNG